MSELKAFRIIQGDTGGYGAPSYKCDTDGNRIEEWSDACEVYDKFEADKVIADLEESHKKEVEQLLMEIVKLKEERRWRKFPDEKPPKYTWCLVSGKSQMGNYIVITDFFEEDDWAENPKLDDGALDIEWWMPLPSAPKEAK